MTEKPAKQKIVAVVGPTASGKTSLSIKLAKQFAGEVISADSRQIYRGLDIGTGKVTEAEMQGVPHHILDIRDPNESYSAFEFGEDARAAIQEIAARAHLPIIAGGTFFYLQALLHPDSLPQVGASPERRSELEAMTISELVEILEAIDPERATVVDQANPRRLVRSIEIAEALGQVPAVTESPSLFNTLIIGIQTDKEILRENFRRRGES